MRRQPVVTKGKKQLVKLCRPISLLMAAVLLLALMDPPAQAQAERVRLQGSTTFQSLLIDAHKAKIENGANVKLEVIANKSIWGLTALIEGRADVAMISADLVGERRELEKHAPKEVIDKLQSFEIARSRIALAVHPSNAVAEITIGQMARILKGEIANWKELGGADLPIRVVVVREGGGTVVALRAQTIRDEPIAAPNIARLESPRHVLTVVAQDPGALGVTQLRLLRKAGLPELSTDAPIEQRLYLVTRGDPSPAVKRMIDAVRIVAVEHIM